ncbi:phosphoenolpyruvate--protein phosphotransferase [Leeia sp. TBRC 13508]|uniref:Phosphoenolpyruvate-protein phosphotransferase n=1 Tax=Leeia speluncae TaxID=2884804 RepID=A0ABS8D871_9NEIS|nr:phosphoenolpyruvate--protein phosphotransferase [Leeia speluncae]MCB6184337.1 phosphoenolpyruvate--protein phosphotransferase [Leeia speluncae]
MILLDAQVRVKEGLHTRPAAQLAKMLKKFDSAIDIKNHAGKSANAKSSVKLMLLGVKEMEQIQIALDGPDESEASEFIMESLSDPNFGLDIADDAGTIVQGAMPLEQAEKKPVLFAHHGIKGISGSKGCAAGAVYIYIPQKLTADRQVIEAEDVPNELNRFRKSLGELEKRFVVSASSDNQNAQIIQALMDVAQDEEFVGAIIRGIEDKGDAAAVTLRVGAVLAATFEAMPDEYMRARAEDIRGVTRQLASILLGQKLPDLTAIEDDCILVANDLSAWEFSKVPIDKVMGLVCIGGSATSHVAIMARTYGRPAVLGVPLTEADLQKAKTIIVDGDEGHIIINPEENELAHYQRVIEAENERKHGLAKYKELIPATRSGKRIEVAANLGSLAEIKLAKEAGAMGVGLFRTELLFMQGKQLPDENEQFETYKELLTAFSPLPVIIRTLDIGGDKPVAGIEFPKEENPFLGWRGVRMCLDRLDVFKPQLRALLRAAAFGNLKIMVPMISDVEEVRKVKVLLNICREELRSEQIAVGDFELGIMIETPAAVLQADAMAEEVSFFSIGTNDLTQYVMAVDRANAQISGLYRTSHPAVLKAVELTCEAAQKAGIWVGICGESAADQQLTEAFVNFGVSELSMSPASILAMKKKITELN